MVILVPSSDDQTSLWQGLEPVEVQTLIPNPTVNWLKVNFAQPLRLEDLAERVRMRPSTFHHQFRQLTAMSPLQYQKWLRLNEARRLMLNDAVDAASAGFQVGYESPSQFSREYARHFGAPPRRDVAQLRHAAEQVTGRGRGGRRVRD